MFGTPSAHQQQQQPMVNHSMMLPVQGLGMGMMPMMGMMGNGMGNSMANGMANPMLAGMPNGMMASSMGMDMVRVSALSDHSNTCALTPCP